MDNEPKFTVASLPMVAAGHVITCDNEFLTRVGLTNALSLSLVHAATEYQLKHKVYVVERFSLDCRKTKTKVNTLANQRT